MRFNSQWLSRSAATGWIKLAAQLQRRADARAARFQAALRGRASRSRSTSSSIRWRRRTTRCALQADVELGGTDQLFNLNVGRDIMPAFDLEPQIVMTTPLLEGLDGVEKMSKSLGNYVGVTDAPGEMFGKLMSIRDELMWRYYVLLTDLAPTEIDALQGTGVAAARCIRSRPRSTWPCASSTDFHSTRRRPDGRPSRVDRRFARKELPADVPVVTLARRELPATWTHLLVQLGLAGSSSDAGRKLKEGAARDSTDRSSARCSRLHRASSKRGSRM